jgi:hypothetical protein
MDRLMSAPEFMRPAEAAAHFQVSVDTLQRWSKAGLIGKSKRGGMVWFVTQDIVEVIAAPLKARTVVPMQAHPATDQDWRKDEFWTGATAAESRRSQHKEKARSV